VLYPERLAAVIANRSSDNMELLGASQIQVELASSSHHATRKLRVNRLTQSEKGGRGGAFQKSDVLLQEEEQYP
jgi:hypothetical protein